MATNPELVRNLYDALARGDVPTVLAGLDPGVEWTEAEGIPYRGTYIGPEAVLNGVFARLATEWDGFQVTPREHIDGGDQVVTLGRYAGAYKATGKAFEADFAHVWTLRDGKVIRFRQYVDSALVQDAIQEER